MIPNRPMRRAQLASPTSAGRVQGRPALMCFNVFLRSNPALQAYSLHTCKMRGPQSGPGDVSMSRVPLPQVERSSTPRKTRSILDTLNSAYTCTSIQLVYHGEFHRGISTHLGGEILVHCHQVLHANRGWGPGSL